MVSGRSRASGIEINDHRPGEIRETEFSLPPSKYEGRLRKRGRPSLLTGYRWAEAGFLAQ